MRLLYITAITLLLSACQSLPFTSPARADSVAGPVTASRGETQQAAPRSSPLTPSRFHIVTAADVATAVAKAPLKLKPGPARHYPKDLLGRIRAESRLPIPNRKRVQIQINWYAKHPQYLRRTLKRGAPFLPLIVAEVEKRGMPVEFALLPIVESAFDPFAYSHGRASGIWQFVPGTSRRYHLKLNWWYDGRRNVPAATRAALDYLQYLHTFFKGDWMLALAAYNSGEGNVRNAVRKNRRRHKAVDFWSLDLPRETEAYVPKLLALSELIQHPQKYKLQLPQIPNKPFLERVDIGSQLDLALAADISGLSMDEIYRYNAAFNRWATDPDGPHYLMVPVENAARLRAGLRTIGKHDRIKWVRYRVRTGDSVSSIAVKFSTSKQLLRSVNRLRRDIIQVGQRLMIPSATRSLNQYTLSADRRLAMLQTKRHGGYKKLYRVKAGDTLWQLSRNNGVNLRKLAKWNGMAPTDPLSIGRKIVIWKKSRGRRVAFIPRGLEKTRKIRYKVHSGDSLARISQKFQVALKDLLRWNRIDRRKYLKPGQSLTLFVDISRQSGI